ncbi:MAG: phytanoyl-CoA dioxygenase family protein [Myxococcota bacterium]|jgi:hypothetical protein|nr:phytanoyl-CoA dioxygenase family protein [Myxococcota bacterium]
MVLEQDDILFFRENGYLIKRGLLCPDLMERARNRLWKGAPHGRSASDPATWVGPFNEEEESRQGDNVRRGFRWLYREPGKEPWMVELLPKNPDVWSTAEELLGAGVIQEPESVRGIYCTLPFGEVPLPRVQPHLDAYASHLGVLGYIDQVEPGGGGFTVWPKSHKKLYYAFESRYGDKKSKNYAEIYAQINAEIPPVEISGQAGDVVFWHHRLGHNASGNGSARIRQAIFYDFVKRDMSRTLELPPANDMWCDWSKALSAGL